MTAARIVCPDCGVGAITVHVGCDACGLTWDDLLAADDVLAEVRRRHRRRVASPTTTTRGRPARR